MWFFLINLLLTVLKLFINLDNCTCGGASNNICKWSSSPFALAYDGSGYVIRDKANHSLCTFKTGKQYNCDLNASYNIGARYFIKEIEKTTSKKKWADIVAKVPQVSTRTQCTLSTLINIVALLT